MRPIHKEKTSENQPQLRAATHVVADEV